ncbi:pre-B-cell leukemia transcription factor 4 [Elysia marginata]|uniref:Pre-B-cell leukemia transcription factor 4 n=1 Tax=Elysia marginata TaxID=1093978 RepID=A0AAV4FRX7_9GAST|nr:pre-B-cell leukemia transcription factor 4 [Elysia marginata]
MAALSNPPEQVSLCESDWYRSEAIDTPNEKVIIETSYSSGLNNHQGTLREADSDKVDTSSGFDAAINELQVGTNRGSTELDENVGDDISPAIQISKTFSLATFGTTPYCNEQPPSIASNTSPLQSYNITNLDNETDCADEKNAGSSKSDKTQPIRQTYNNTPSAVKQFCSTHKRKATKKPIECHVIDLETFSTSHACTIKVEQKDISSKTFRHPSVNSCSNTREDFDKFSTQSIFLTDNPHGFDLMPSKVKQGGPDSLDQQRAYFGDDSKLPDDDATTTTIETNYGHVDMGSFYLQEVSGESLEYVCNLEHIAESEDTSDLVIDLNERTAVDSGIFEVSLTDNNSFYNFADRQLSISSAQEPVKRTSHPRFKEAIVLDSTSRGGGYKEQISFLHDKPVEESPQMYKKNITYNVPHNVRRDLTYYDGMKTLRDPYVTDECGYMYHQNYNSQFLCNRMIPCASSWESTQKSPYSPTITELVEESAQGSWCSDSLTDFFESRDPSDIAQYSQLNTIKDEEETDDADETGFMHETADLNWNHMGQGHDHLTGYFFPENPHTTRFATAALTPPPSESSTPNPPSSHYNDDITTHHWAPLTSPCPLPDYVSNETISTMSPLQESRLQLPYNHLKPECFDSNFLNHGSQRAVARPFPSMADAFHSGYSCSTSNYTPNEPASRKIDLNSKRRGKSRKVQIQSDKISTSTPKYSKVNRDNPESTSAFNLPIQGNVIHTKIRPQPRMIKASAADKIPRHNEPLKQHAVDVMTRWYEENIHNPYPTKAQKTAMAQEGQISENQVKSWFANKRNRTHNTKPKVHKRAMEEKLKELFKDLKNTNSTTAMDNSHIIQQLSGIIQHCHMKLD